MRNAEINQVVDSAGDPGRARTCDPLLRRQVLYPAELRDLSFSLNYFAVSDHSRFSQHPPHQREFPRLRALRTRTPGHYRMASWKVATLRLRLDVARRASLGESPRANERRCGRLLRLAGRKHHYSLSGHLHCLAGPAFSGEVVHLGTLRGAVQSVCVNHIESCRQAAADWCPRKIFGKLRGRLRRKSGPGRLHCWRLMKDSRGDACSRKRRQPT